MYVTIIGPATRIEYDAETKVKLIHETTLIKEIPVEDGNPNIEYYFGPLMLADYRYHTVNGEKWELDTNNASVSIDLTVEQAVEAARNRAAEDYVTTEEVLREWSKYSNAPNSIEAAIERFKGASSPNSAA